jgi:hypothetical protein
LLSYLCGGGGSRNHPLFFNHKGNIGNKNYFPIYAVVEALETTHYFLTTKKTKETNIAFLFMPWLRPDKS